MQLRSMLRRSGRQRAARDYLASALDLAYRHGATALADRARAELIVAGRRPRHAAKTDSLCAAPRKTNAVL
jgi:hypothetical protein